MKPKTYRLIKECVENGVEAGFNRAYKHTDDPTQLVITNNIIREIMFQINEWFDFEEPEE